MIFSSSNFFFIRFNQIKFYCQSNQVFLPRVLQKDLHYYHQVHQQQLQALGSFKILGSVSNIEVIIFLALSISSCITNPKNQINSSGIFLCVINNIVINSLEFGIKITLLSIVIKVVLNIPIFSTVPIYSGAFN